MDCRHPICPTVSQGWRWSLHSYNKLTQGPPKSTHGLVKVYSRSRKGHLRSPTPHECFELFKTSDGHCRSPIFRPVLVGSLQGSCRSFHDHPSLPTEGRPWVTGTHNCECVTWAIVNSNSDAGQKQNFWTCLIFLNVFYFRRYFPR